MLARWAGTTLLLLAPLAILAPRADGFVPLHQSALTRSFSSTRGSSSRTILGAAPNSRPSSGGSGGGDAKKPRPKNRTGRRQDQLDGMAVGSKFELGYDLPDEEVPLEQDDTLPVVRTIAAAADKRKGEDIYAIRVSSLTIVSSFFVLITGNSRPQIQAIAAAILEDVQEQHDLEPRNGGEGTADSGWILLDFGSVIVNVMTPVARQYYNLEKLWRKGEVVDLADVIKPNTPFGSTRPSLTAAPQPLEDDDAEEAEEPQPDENDPFWS